MTILKRGLFVVMGVLALLLYDFIASIIYAIFAFVVVWVWGLISGMSLLEIFLLFVLGGSIVVGLIGGAAGVFGTLLFQLFEKILNGLFGLIQKENKKTGITVLIVITLCLILVSVRGVVTMVNEYKIIHYIRLITVHGSLILVIGAYQEELEHKLETNQ